MSFASAIIGVCCLQAQAPQGIPRDLARQRAERIVGLRYDLQFNLVPHASSAAGKEELMFKLTTAGPLLLDFREGTVSKLVVNGKDAPARIDNGHIELPAELLKISPNARAKEKRPAAPLTDNLG
ncbi:MAG: hypothetical protein ACRD4F_15285, partial [Candidatus Angelobacter sp.]